MEKELKRIGETHLSLFLQMMDISNLEICFHKDSLKAEDITVKNDMMWKEKHKNRSIYLFFAILDVSVLKRTEIAIDFLQIYNRD